MFSFLRPLIFSLDPEVAHDLAIRSLKTNLIPESFFYVKNEEILQLELFNKKFRNPVGLAAGFDKSAEVYNSLFKFGFGFVEVGTVTPRAQFGNPKPRVFRLEKDQALINRLGFNNHGADVVSKRISENIPEGILGVNIGPNKETSDKSDDFEICLSKLHHNADYLTINISSPNTEGLRDFHNKNSLSVLLERISKIKKNNKIDKPILIKLSPDINSSEISNVCEITNKYSIDGLIISNSTDRHRDDLLDTNKNEKGGLSGKPLFDLSNKLIKNFYKELKGKVPIIGVGGVDTGQSAFEKISFGASVVQLYTGMIYKGPTIAKEIKTQLISILSKNRIKNIREAIGINAWPYNRSQLYNHY